MVLGSSGRVWIELWRGCRSVEGMLVSFPRTFGGVCVGRVYGVVMLWGLDLQDTILGKWPCRLM